MISVLCPSRGRPAACKRMAESVNATSDADVMVYVDNDDPLAQEYRDTLPTSAILFRGESVGRGAAINNLCQWVISDRYLLVSDDVTFVRSGWDQEIERAMHEFQDEIGLVHLASENGMSHVNWPCVSRTWVDALGWFNPPNLKTHCQDTVLGCLAHAIGRIKYIEPQVIHHTVMRAENFEADAAEDMKQFLSYMALDFDKDLAKLRKVMR